MGCNPAAWGLPPDATELVSERDSNHKKFILVDGQYTSVFTDSPIHYPTLSGTWEEVDYTFRASGNDFVMDRRYVQIVANNAGLAFLDRATGKGVQWRYLSQPVVDCERIAFDHLGLRWSYAGSRTGVKMQATVAARQGAKRYSFPYELLGGAADLAINANGNLQNDVFIYPAPFLIGADGLEYACGPWEKNGQTVAFTVDDTALPEAAFPYVIDPTGTSSSNPGTDDGTVYADSGNNSVYNPTTGSSVDVSGTLLSVERTLNATPIFWRNGQALIRFANVNQIPDDATITGATISLYCETVTNGNNWNLCAEWISSSAWPLDAADFKATPANTALAGVAVSTITTGLSKVYTLQGADSTTIPHVGTGTTYAALRFYFPDPGSTPSNNKLQFRSWEHASGLGPQLSITYTGPAFTANKITYGRAATHHAWHQSAFRFKNGTELVAYHDVDAATTVLALKTTSATAWQRNATLLGTVDAPGGALDTLIAIDANPDDPGDVAWCAYRTGGNTIRIRKLTGNVDGSITADATTYIAATYTGSSYLRLIVDKYNYVHVLRRDDSVSPSWFHHVFNPATNTWGAVTTGIGTTNQSLVNLFVYDKTNHRITQVNHFGNSPVVVEAKVCTLTTTGGVSWSVNYAGSTAGLQGSSTVYFSADVDATGLVHMWRPTTNGVGVGHHITFNPATHLWGSPAEIGSPITVWQQGGVMRVLTNGTLICIGSVKKGSPQPTPPFPIAYCTYLGGTSGWSDPVDVAPKDVANADFQLLQRSSYDPDKLLYVWDNNLGAGAGNNVMEIYTGAVTPAPTTSPTTPTDVQRWKGLHWTREATRFGGTSPF